MSSIKGEIKMRDLSMFEKIIYYPVTIAWTFITVSIAFSGRREGSLAIPLVYLILVGCLWFMPMIKNRVAKKILRLLFIVISIPTLYWFTLWVLFTLAHLNHHYKYVN